MLFVHQNILIYTNCIPYFGIILLLIFVLQNIQGEIYEVDEQMLAKLDELEDHPNFYERELTTIDVTQNAKGDQLSTQKECWCYFLKKYKPRMLDLPYLESYDSKGDHGLKYVERCDRVDVTHRARDDVYQE